VFAHAGHWAVNLIYAGPVVLFALWLCFEMIRNRREEASSEDETEADPTKKPTSKKPEDHS
jgi:hypothetical protein